MLTNLKNLGPALALAVAAAFGSPASAQIRLDSAPNSIDGNQVCTEDNLLQVSDSEDDCTAGAQDISTMTFQSGSSLILNNGATATINGAATFGSTVQISGNLTAGNATFTGLFSVQGSSATFATPTFFTFPSTFQAPATFNGTTNFTAGMTTTNIANSGTINTGSLNASTGLTVAAGAAVNMGGNIVQGVAAGVANTDAVNVGQLNAATAGITTSVTALQTTVATQATQITAIQTVNTTQSSQIAAVEAMNTTQSNQINALQATQDLVSNRVDTLFDLRSVDRRDMKQGVASAMAMASAPIPSEPGRVAYAVNGATFRGEYAIGGSISYRLPGSRPLSVNAGFSFAGNKNNGARVGLAGEF